MTYTKKFNGFSPEVKNFFIRLCDNNNKEWFAENRSFYEKEIKELSKLLVAEMAEHFAQTGLPYIADTKTSLFRINRDTRFSKDKSPYKTNLGIYFPFSTGALGTKPSYSAGLYFHLDYNESFIAGGLHAPVPDALKAVRQKISNEYEEFINILENKTFKKEFDVSIFKWGEPLKSMPRGYPAEHPAAPYLKLKHLVVGKNLKYEDTESPSLTEILLAKAIALVPFHNFLNSAITQ